MKGWGLLLALIMASGVIVFFGPYEHPPLVVEQRGYRGLAMAQVNTARHLENVAAANQVPAPIDPVEPSGTKSSEVYANVQVLGDVDADEFTRLMSAITEWVAPEQGCAYCHAEGEELSSDSLYTKVVARRMLQMTKHLNAEWQPHVGTTGVTCYTCHRGNNVPKDIWFKDPGPEAARGMAGNHAGQNTPGTAGRLRVAAVRPVHAVPGAGQRHPGGLDHVAARGQPEVDQADRMDLRADDAHVPGPGRELHLLPQQPLVLGLGSELAAAHHGVVRDQDGP